MVTGDCCNIAGRVKEIDPAYFLVYNTLTARYELHHLDQAETLALHIPYTQLDARTLTLARSTRMERLQGLLAEMDRHNQSLTKG